MLYSKIANICKQLLNLTEEQVFIANRMVTENQDIFRQNDINLIIEPNGRDLIASSVDIKKLGSPFDEDGTTYINNEYAERAVYNFNIYILSFVNHTQDMNLAPQKAQELLLKLNSTQSKILQKAEDVVFLSHPSTYSDISFTENHGAFNIIKLMFNLKVLAKSAITIKEEAITEIDLGFDIINN